jgi:hypothetical protein
VQSGKSAQYQSDALATNSNARVLAIGNPDDPASHFAEICKPGSGWHVITVDGMRTPNFTVEEVAKFPAVVDYMEREGIPYSTEWIPDELRPLLISPEWVDERIKRWGADSPIFQSKVRGQFPDISDDTLIMPRWIEAAQARELERTRRPKLGADIARYGDDMTTIYRREGGWVRKYRQHSKMDTMATAGHIAMALRDITAEPGLNDFPTAVVDEVGVDAGVLDRLQEQGLDVAGFNGGSQPRDKERFINARAELYWTIREEFEAGGVDLDPADDRLVAQLGAIKWAVDSKGRIKIESKDDMRKRGLPSPDHADGFAYSWVDRGAMTMKTEEMLVPSDPNEIDFLTEPM